MAAREALGSRVAALVADLRIALEHRSPAAPASWRDDAGSGLATILAIWRDAAAAISKTATKLALVFSDAEPTAAEARSICDEMAAACDELYTARTVAGASGAGAPLVDAVDLATRHLLGAVVELARGDRRASSEAPLAGVVWEAAEHVARGVPKSNRIAYRRAFLAHATQLKDVIDEFRPRTEAPPIVENDDDDEADGDMFGDDPFFDAAYTSEAERLAAAKCVVVLERVGAAFKTALLGIDDRGQAGAFDAVASIFDATTRAARAATTVGEALYAPIDADEILNALGDLSAAMAALGDRIDVRRTTDGDDTGAESSSSSSSSQMMAVVAALEAARAAVGAMEESRRDDEVPGEEDEDRTVGPDR